MSALCWRTVQRVYDSESPADRVHIAEWCCQQVTDLLQTLDMHEHVGCSCRVWPHLPFIAGLGADVLLWRAGGGFTMWGLDTHDSLCRALANGVPCVVVSVAYRSASPLCQSPICVHVMPAGGHSGYVHALRLACTNCLTCKAPALALEASIAQAHRKELRLGCGSTDGHMGVSACLA